jgi:phage tail-like protein
MIKRLMTTLAVAALLGSVSLAAVPRVQAQQDPLTASRFSLIVDNVEIASFNELVSLESEIDPVAKAGSNPKPSTTSSEPVLPHITLRRGLTNSVALWSWNQAAVTGPLDTARKTVTLIMYNTDGSPVAKFTLVRAWPESIEVTATKAGASEILIETVTLVGDSLQRVSPN